MEELSIDFTKQTLESCFKQNNYIIPDYQREYVWEENNVNPLMEDLVDSFSHDSKKQYFVGTIVVYRGSGKYEVIDGQQRLSTFFIMLCALRKLLQGKGEKTELLDSLIYSTGVDDDGNDVNSYHLELQYEDASGYLEKIYNDIATLETAKTESEKKLYSAYTTILSSISKEYDTTETLKRFMAFVLKRILFVQIETKDMADALKIFETINQRGVGLNPMDLLKNLIFMQVPREKFKELNVKWKTITDSLEKIDEQPLRFLRYYIMARYDTSGCKDGIIREDQIYDWLRDNENQCKYGTAPFAFVDNMIEAVKDYAAYLKPADDFNGNAHLKNISLFAGGKYKLHIQLLLAANQMDNEAKSELKRVLESVVYYATITRTKTNTLERQFALWCPKLRTIKDIDGLSTFVHNDIMPVLNNWKLAYKAIFMALGMDNVQQYRIRFILGRISRYIDVIRQSAGDVAVGISEYIGKGVEIEHIMPQTCSDYSQYGMDDVDFEVYRNRIGNLTLLEKSINASIQNDGYKNKCNDYAKSKLYLTSSLNKLENVGQNTGINKLNSKMKCWYDWNKVSIDQRQEMLYELSESIWRLE